MRIFFAAAALAACAPASAATITYVADNSLGIDPGLTVDVKDTGPGHAYVNGGGSELAFYTLGTGTEANVHTNFDVRGDFQASLTTNVKNLGKGRFLFGAYHYDGGALPSPFGIGPGAQTFALGTVGTLNSYVVSEDGGGSKEGVPFDTDFTLGIERTGSVLSTYYNGQLLASATYLSTDPFRFIISLGAPGGQSASALARVSDFRITYDPTIRFNPGPGSVPEPATWAMLLVGFGAMGAAMRRRTARLRPELA